MIASEDCGIIAPKRQSATKTGVNVVARVVQQIANIGYSSLTHALLSPRRVGLRRRHAMSPRADRPMFTKRISPDLRNS